MVIEKRPASSDNQEIGMQPNTLTHPLDHSFSNLTGRTDTDFLKAFPIGGGFLHAKSRINRLTRTERLELIERYLERHFAIQVDLFSIDQKPITRFSDGSFYDHSALE